MKNISIYYLLTVVVALNLWAIPTLSINKLKLLHAQETNLSNPQFVNKIYTKNVYSPSYRSVYISPTPTPTLKPIKIKVPIPTLKVLDQDNSLLTAVNSWRQARNLQQITKDNSICEMVSSRINELVARGELDNHEGFHKYLAIHPLNTMKVNHIAENLASGTDSNQEILTMWENSPPHRDNLLAQGEMRKGCATVKNGLAVLISGY